MIDVQSRALDYVGGGMLVFVSLVFFYGMIFLCNVPYKIAKGRNHPHQDAIFVAGWVSPVFMHVMWPFLWVWAMMHKPDLPADEEFGKRNADSGRENAASGGEA